MVDTIDEHSVKKVLMDLGWKDFQAAALCGHFMQGFPHITDNEPMDEKTVFGIGRWKDIFDPKNRQFKPGRLTQLVNFSISQGKKIDDILMQANFVHLELTKGPMKGVGDKLKATTNLEEAILVCYEYTGLDKSLNDNVIRCAKILI